MNWNFTEKLKSKLWIVYAVEMAALLLTLGLIFLYYDVFIVYVTWKVTLCSISFALLFGFSSYFAVCAKYEFVSPLKAILSILFGAGVFYGLGVLIAYVLNVLLFDHQEVEISIAITMAYWILCLVVAYSITTVNLIERLGKTDVKWRRVTAITVLAVCLAGIITPSAIVVVDLAKGTPFDFVAPPAVFENDVNYSIIWATTTPGSGEVEVTFSDGVVRVYKSETTDAIPDIYGKVHRVDIPRSVLDSGASYKLISRENVGYYHYGYFLDTEPIISESYKLREKKTEGEISFLCISDVQGSEFYAMRAISEAKKNYSYDFVLTVGDYSSHYSSEDDMIYTLIATTGLACGGELPVLYTAGNHEGRGNYAAAVQKFIPTPSITDEKYYTYAYGDLFLTVLNFGDHRNDDGFENENVCDYGSYRDRQYNWLINEVVRKRPYEAYKYNVGVGHVPIINEDNEYSDLDDVNRFKLMLEQIGIDLMVSGHTHTIPRVVKADDCFFDNIQVGSIVNDKNGETIGFRNSIITINDEGYSYEVYDSYEKYKD